jgi:hypothetical protein
LERPTTRTLVGDVDAAGDRYHGARVSCGGARARAVSSSGPFEAKAGDRVRVLLGPFAGTIGTVRRESTRGPGWVLVLFEDGEGFESGYGVEPRANLEPA